MNEFVFLKYPLVQKSNFGEFRSGICAYIEEEVRTGGLMAHGIPFKDVPTYLMKCP